MVGLVRHALQLDARRIRADQGDLPVDDEPADGVQGDLGPVVGPRRAVETRAVEVEQQHVPGADLARVRRQVLPAHHVARLLVPEVQQHAVADQPLQGESCRIHAVAVVMVGELDVRAAVGRHADVLQDVPGVGAALVLRVQLVGEMRLQVEVVFLFARLKGMAEIDQPPGKLPCHGCSVKV